VNQDELFTSSQKHNNVYTKLNVDKPDSKFQLLFKSKDEYFAFLLPWDLPSDDTMDL